MAYNRVEDYLQHLSNNFFIVCCVFILLYYLVFCVFIDICVYNLLCCYLCMLSCLTCCYGYLRILSVVFLLVFVYLVFCVVIGICLYVCCVVIDECVYYLLCCYWYMFISQAVAQPSFRPSQINSIPTWGYLCYYCIAYFVSAFLIDPLQTCITQPMYIGSFSNFV